MEGSTAQLSLQNPLGSNHEAIKAAGPYSWSCPPPPRALLLPLLLFGLLGSYMESGVADDYVSNVSSTACHLYYHLAKLSGSGGISW